MGLHDVFSIGRSKVWWEFATPETWGKPPEERELGRDYAYFQETGNDKLAKYAKHKYAITRGIHAVDETALAEVEEYLNYIIDATPMYNYR